MRINKFVYPAVAIVYCLLFGQIISTLLGESFFNAVLFSAFMMSFGLMMEYENRKAARALMAKNLYRNYQKNTIRDPDALDRSLRMQFLRLWHYTALWPMHLFYLIKEECKKTQGPK